MKTYRELERIVKGFANHRRIQILDLLKNTSDLSVWQIAEMLKVNYKTISVHISRLMTSGLVSKRNKGREVTHQITPLGISVLKYLKTIR